METKNRIPVMTLLLILINVVVYLYVEIHGSSYDAEYMIKMGAVYEPYIVQRHEYYRLITHFFLHFGFDHLFNNIPDKKYKIKNLIFPVTFSSE